MKVKFFTNRRKVFLLAICIVMVLTALISVPMLTANADYYKGCSKDMSLEDIHKELQDEQSVSTDTPAITVFMHGLGGNAGDWSNGFTGVKGSSTSFAEDPVSIIEKMRYNVAPFDTYLYRAIPNDEDEKKLKIYSGYTYTEVEMITDFSHHTIVVMEIYDTKKRLWRRCMNSFITLLIKYRMII